MINAYLGLKPLSDSEARAEVAADQFSQEKVAQLLADDSKMTWKRLATPVMPPRFAALCIVCGHNWLPTSNRTTKNEE